jgi:hypothetical protein
VPLRFEGALCRDRRVRRMRNLFVGLEETTQVDKNYKPELYLLHPERTLGPGRVEVFPMFVSRPHPSRAHILHNSDSFIREAVISRSSVPPGCVAAGVDACGGEPLH